MMPIAGVAPHCLLAELVHPEVNGMRWPVWVALGGDVVLSVLVGGKW